MQMMWLSEDLSEISVYMHQTEMSRSSVTALQKKLSHLIIIMLSHD